MRLGFCPALVLLTAVNIAAAIAGAAWAQGEQSTTQAQPTLRYNYEYVCHNEHVVVGHCRKDSDIPGSIPTRPEENYCAVYYPDRPQKPNSTVIPDTILRSKVIDMLDACGAFGSAGHAQAAQGAPAQAAEAAQPTATPSGTPSNTAPSNAQLLQQFCGDLVKLKSLAHQGFTAIDIGPMKGTAAHTHATSMVLPGAECEIDHYDNGLSTAYSCGWGLPDDDAAAEARFRSAGTMIAHCLGLSPDWSLMGGTNWEMDLLSWKTNFQLSREERVQMWLSVFPDILPGAPAQAAAGARPAASQPGTPSNTASQEVPPSKATTQQPFCDVIVKLKSLTDQGFRAIDLGPINGESAGLHATSTALPGGECFVVHLDDGSTNYGCKWGTPGAKAAAEARFRSLGTVIARCLNVSPDWSKVGGSNSNWKLDLVSGNADFRLQRAAGAEIILVVAPDY
ncbi:MAG: hypothetical protein ACRES9_08855 [Gammaproteobacteria bacterium]